jgi:hypothetical protein
MDVNQYKTELLTHWQIQENLLQWYRSIFLTSQSILIGFSLNISANESSTENGVKVNLLFFSVWFSGVISLYFWRSVCKNRALDVSYFQNEIITLENNSSKINNSLLSEFKLWQKKSYVLKLKDIKKAPLKNYIKTTRFKMDILLPSLYFLLWLMLVFVKLKFV